MKPQDPIEFDEASHQYSCRGIPYMSVSSVVAYVSNKFDTETQSREMAERHGHSPEFWKRKWQQETDTGLHIGDRLHTIKEELAYASGIIKDEEGVHRVQNLDRISEIAGYEYFDWPDGAYVELKLWNHQYRLAGRTDKTRFFNRFGFRYASIGDYKTNKKISQKGWYDWQAGTYRMLKAPLDHLHDCEYNKYALQLSLYQFMLEEMGFRPYTRSLYHFPPLPLGLADYPGERAKRPTIYKLPYLREEVITLLNHLTHGKSFEGPANMQ